MPTPKQLAINLNSLTQHVSQISAALHDRATLSLAQIGKECERAALNLDNLLRKQHVPQTYKVAVVGRFKTGKSAFVNELLGQRLAGEDTNPETAAVTSFRYGTSTAATIRFLSADEWNKIEDLYRDDPKHLDAQRAKLWHEFSKPRKNKKGELITPPNLHDLKSQHIRSPATEQTITLGTSETKKAQKEFRTKLKKFTSSSEPLHCLVHDIQITLPSELLTQGITLIDTPGLDDTERFRVSLTEKTVDDIDAILFLTKSGVAYSQSEKEFLLSLLRKGSLRQLIVVVTQVDQTYEQYCRAARDDGDEPDSVTIRIDRERTRIKSEIADTLKILQQEDENTLYTYQEQFSQTPISFTSVFAHRDASHNVPNPCVIYPDDPGGIVKLKKRLLDLLSTESRLALATDALVKGTESELLNLQSTLGNTLLTIKQVKNQEEAEKKLRTFRDQFRTASNEFKDIIVEQINLLRLRLKDKARQHTIQIENIVLLSRDQIANFEVQDVGRHWRTRRSGYWGYMRQFQQSIANRIFPKVQTILNDNIESFMEFRRDFEVYLGSLSTNGTRISKDLELGDTLPFDLDAKFDESLSHSIQRAQELISAEEAQIIRVLDDFVTEEVSDRIVDARKKVSDVFGLGTTDMQSREVKQFYSEVKELLARALADHISEKSNAFATFLIEEAEMAPRDALAEIDTLMEQTSANILASASARIAGKKEQIERNIQSIKVECDNALGFMKQVDNKDAADTLSCNSEDVKVETSFESNDTTLQHNDQPAVDERPDSKAQDEYVEVLDENTELINNDPWYTQIQDSSAELIERIKLKDGASKWPWEAIFSAKLLEKSEKIALIDPYLFLHHQSRNLSELLSYLGRTVHPKTIDIITSYGDPDDNERQDKRWTELAADLFRSDGITLKWNRSYGLHDRSLISDNGIVWKLGRGLDIYKPALGLASMRVELRRVRGTEIDVFKVSRNHGSN